MPDIIHYLLIKSTPDKIYNAITEHIGISNWWTPDNTLEPKVNAIAEFNFGDKDRNKMEIRNLTKNERVEWLCVEGDKEWIGTNFIFELEPSDVGCYLRFSQKNWRKQTDFYAMCNYHWGYYMRSLKSYCEEGKGTPFRIS